MIYDITVTQCTDRALHALVLGSSYSVCKWICWIWGCYVCYYEKFDLLGWSTVLFGASPTFRKKISPPSSTPASARFFLGLLFNPEDGGHAFLRNVGLSPNYTNWYLEDGTLNSLSVIIFDFHWKCLFRRVFWNLHFPFFQHLMWWLDCEVRELLINHE
jgi:hypothetical protein